MSDPFNKDPSVTYGAPEIVASGIRRITCRNPSGYTFTGTQSYLVGTGEVALIDPGPEDAEHIAALSAALATGERITHIVVTHTHRDHSPAARLIAAETGAAVYAFGTHGAGMSATMQKLAASGADLGGGEGADTAFRLDQVVGDGQRIEGADWGLDVLHTPGHLSNHVSLVLSGTGIVFTGDTVMGWNTTLVSPPDGDMAALMASLRRLHARNDRLYLPGHGHAIEDPEGMLRHQIGHREQRFTQILDALSDGPADADGLARAIYTELDPAMLPAAARNVLASLIGLMDEGRVASQGPVSATARFERI